MASVSQIVCVFLFVFVLATAGAAQKKDKVEIGFRVSVETADKSCKDLKPGRAVTFPKPDYPAEARIAR